MEKINMTETIKNKKEYHAPKLEVIGEVRDLTKAGGSGKSDLGGQGIPYQPQ